MYFRDSSRKAPHNAYTTGDGITEGIRIMEYESQRTGDWESHYKFNEDDENEIQLTDGQDAAVVQPGYLVNKPWFVYNTETGLYERFQNGAEQIDANDNSQVAVKIFCFRCVTGLWQMKRPDICLWIRQAVDPDITLPTERQFPLHGPRTLRLRRQNILTPEAVKLP